MVHLVVGAVGCDAQKGGELQFRGTKMGHSTTAEGAAGASMLHLRELQVLCCVLLLMFR